MELLIRKNPKNGEEKNTSSLFKGQSLGCIKALSVRRLGNHHKN